MIVLDTNVVSELMRTTPEPSVLLWVDAQDPARLWLTSVTVQELFYGIARLPIGKRQSRFNELVTAMLDDDFGGQVVAYDGEAAAIAGKLLARCEREGRRMPLADAQIAAICLAHRATLVTRNTKDFVATGLRLINPWEDS
ncbi:type II toxin-antitoxin system VapC family toxin [Azovibrio restrictus]|uniref:type II toxin-antitoxin system VapC family toxin n=1 Tax=Azovibrio restrictus TaxID=146938 RepID=UPI0026F25BE8|nr:type II toxin-antitoxin system VapC family toxin [Azovibrio restrictus]MCE1172667.1 type II toxin-antitoxin system VapC family toxin [Azovibrio sp.]MDD3482222.1 type II toxin-antitoxin system VapC family toxin [Azovibrio restrictus]